jgi:hypothetical protein
MAQRLLTTGEMAGFLVRHPLVAEYIAKTKLAIETGVYDWTQKLPDWFFGMIPPWGMQVQDTSYGLVTVFFGTDGTLYLSGFTAPIGDINKPRYEPPPVLCSDGSEPVLGVCLSDLSKGLDVVTWFGIGLAVFVGYQMFFAKK